MNTTNKRLLWLMALRQPSVWLRGLKLGVPVGLLQVFINQGDYWLHNQVNATVLIKSVISPLLSFVLVLFSAAATWVQRAHLKTNL